ncbi:MAG: hypothetical protein ICV69_11170 [Thermoleophilaceae bacterium]|nr:hypothetical protein [Thermoleophilaceae bacterium]
MLTREYGDLAYFRVPQLWVDTYAVQHPSGPERRTIQSLALHLITLCLAVERGANPAVGPNVHRRVAGRATFHWLEPPTRRGRLNVADVRRAASAAEHAAAVDELARDVWAAWEPHHAAVRAWIERELGASRRHPRGQRRGA